MVAQHKTVIEQAMRPREGGAPLAALAASAAGVGAGGAAFAATAYASQALQLALGVTTATRTLGVRLLPRLAGLTTVCVGSAMA